MADQIEDITNNLMTRKPTRKGPRISNPITREIRKAVLRMHRENPEMANRHIAEHFDIADGRVTEIIQEASTVPAGIRRRT